MKLFSYFKIQLQRHKSKPDFKNWSPAWNDIFISINFLGFWLCIRIAPNKEEYKNLK